MANIIDKFVFALMLDAKGFKEGASDAMSALGSIKNAFLKTYSLIGGFDLFKNMFHTYTDAAKSIDDFSLITGENIYQLQAWQKAIQDTGGDINGLQGTIRKLTDMQAQLKRYGTASGLEEFLRIGIDPRGKSAFQILQQVGKVLSSIKDNARAFNIAKNIGLDESTFIMLRRYGENFDKVIKANERYALINKAAIQQTREYNRLVSSFKTSWLELSQAVMSEILPVLQKELFPVIENGVHTLLDNKDEIKEFAKIITDIIKESAPLLKLLAKGVEGGLFFTSGALSVARAAKGNPFTVANALGQVIADKLGLTNAFANTGEMPKNYMGNLFGAPDLSKLLVPSPRTFNISQMTVVADDPKEFMNKMSKVENSQNNMALQLGSN